MKKFYFRPAIKVEKIKVEKGFATSPQTGETKGFTPGELSEDEDELEF